MPSIKLSFRQKLLVVFLGLFAVHSSLLVVFERSRQRSQKMETLASRLEAYVQMAEACPWPLDSLAPLLPPSLRLTVVDSLGEVVYENTARNKGLENHAQRPEVLQARARGRGHSLRNSVTTGTPYLYYARDVGGGKIIRTALPYNPGLKSLLKVSNGFLYFALALFFTGLGFIWWVSHYFDTVVRRLRNLSAQRSSRRLKQELTGNIAHELRTPVTSIRGFLELLLERELPAEKAQNFLQRAYAQTCHLSELIADMGLLTRMEGHQGAFPTEPLFLSPLVDRVCADLGSRLSEQQLHFCNRLPQGLRVQGNENLLYAVFRNLTDNALRYAGAGAQVEVEVLRETGGQVWLRFADTGRGLPPEGKPDRLFERFYRVSEGRTRDQGGSGLGLAIVKNAVQLHGGGIEARRRKPQGLEFRFSLSLA